MVHKDHKIRVGLWIYDSKDMFDYFFENKAEIEQTAGITLDWDKLDNKKASTICTYIPNLNFNDKSNYSELMSRTIDLVVALREAFTPFLKKYTGN